MLEYKRVDVAVVVECWKAYMEQGRLMDAAANAALVGNRNVIIMIAMMKEIMPNLCVLCE